MTNYRCAALVLIGAVVVQAGSSRAVAGGPAMKDAATPVTTYQDPFAYCAAVGTLDAPDARYTGSPVPESIARGLQKAFDVPASAPLEPFVSNSFWRCMDGKVYACNVGANLPCQAKADTSRTPSAAVTDYCHSNPGSDFIPMVVTGRETIYEWRCDASTPAIVREMTQPDARGFLSNVWYEMRPLGD